MKQNIIKRSEHVFVAGRTGSGKTYLAKKYLANYDHVAVLDTKGTFTWDEVDPKELQVVTSISELGGANKSKIIYRPTWEELEIEYYDAFFKWAYMRRNTIVLVDEAMSVCPSPFKIPDYYKAILTRGRELNVSVWSLTQRPSGIPQVIMSEATHFFIFDLNLAKDREKIVHITGHEEFLERPGRYIFWYWRADTDNPPVRARLREIKN